MDPYLPYRSKNCADYHPNLAQKDEKQLGLRSGFRRKVIPSKQGVLDASGNTGPGWAGQTVASGGEGARGHDAAVVATQDPRIRMPPDASAGSAAADEVTLLEGPASRFIRASLRPLTVKCRISRAGAVRGTIPPRHSLGGMWQTITPFAHGRCRLPLYWILVFPLALLWSGLRPHGGLTWLLDALPAIAAFVALVMTRRRFALTPVSYALLLVLCLLILAGAHYSFSRVPLFNELKPWLGTERNDFDKLAHFFQGFAPALVLREILIRFEVLAKRSWLWVVVVGLSLALSATYELVEWWAALILRSP